MNRALRNVTLYPRAYAQTEIDALLRLEELMRITTARIESLFSKPSEKSSEADPILTITGVDPGHFSKH
jgi:hypothetical protein